MAEYASRKRRLHKRSVLVSVNTSRSVRSAAVFSALSRNILVSSGGFHLMQNSWLFTSLLSGLRLDAGDFLPAWGQAYGIVFMLPASILYCRYVYFFRHPRLSLSHQRPTHSALCCPRRLEPFGGCRHVFSAQKRSPDSLSRGPALWSHFFLALTRVWLFRRRHQTAQTDAPIKSSVPADEPASAKPTKQPIHDCGPGSRSIFSEAQVIY